MKGEATMVAEILHGFSASVNSSATCGAVSRPMLISYLFVRIDGGQIVAQIEKLGKRGVTEGVSGDYMHIERDRGCWHSGGEGKGCLSVDVGAPAEISHEKEMNSIASSTVGPPEGTQVVDDDGLQVTCFTEDLHDVTIHFQIIRLKKQIYAWIGCNTAKFGHLYAAAPTRPNNTVSVTSILGGTSDNTGSSIARRLVLKTGLSIILACNIPKNSPILEADAERKLIEKLTALGYTISKSQGFALSS